MTNCSRRPLLSSLKASTACQNHRTTLLSLVQCFRRVLVFQSARSIFPSPPMISWKDWKSGFERLSFLLGGRPKRDTYLQFFVVERFEEVLWDQLTEALLKSQKLSFDSTHEPPVHIQSGTPTRSVTSWEKRICIRQKAVACHHLTYSFLFSSVTGTFRPFGLSSCWDNFPKALCSTQNVWSRTEVMSFSLKTKQQQKKNLIKSKLC